ncbi:MAG: L-threonylcarbamoyladenylate synthase [Spirochaetota bacterium]
MESTEHRCRSAVFLDWDAVAFQQSQQAVAKGQEVSHSHRLVRELGRLSQHHLLCLLCSGESVSESRDLLQQVRAAGIPYECWNQRWEDENLKTAADSLEVMPAKAILITNNILHAKHSLRAGFTVLYLLQGERSLQFDDLPADLLLFHTLTEAADWLESHPKGQQSLHEAIKHGAGVIQHGGLTVFPTETVYGLGADALQPEAVAKIFSAKQRPFNDPLITHVASEQQVRMLVQQIPEKAERLMQAFWPGPLTLVMEKSSAVPDIVTAGNPTVAIRMPGNPIALELIQCSGTPIAAPSANTFGKTSPTTAHHVADQLEGAYEAIINGGACRVGVESTVLSLVTDPPTLLRPGGVTIENIEEIIGHITVTGSDEKIIFDSPGMFPSHYAPKTPMIVTPEPQNYAHEPNIAVMLFGPPQTDYTGKVYVLSARRDPAEAALQLYQTMRNIDREQLRLIVAEKLPSEGLGAAVNDRMNRASRR